MLTVLACVLCFMIGGTVGVFTMCLMFAAKEADRHMEEDSQRRTDD